MLMMNGLLLTMRLRSKEKGYTMYFNLKSRSKNFTGSEYHFVFEVMNPLTTFAGSVFIRAANFPSDVRLDDLTDKQILDAIVTEMLHTSTKYFDLDIVD